MSASVKKETQSGNQRINLTPAQRAQIEQQSQGLLEQQGQQNALLSSIQQRSSQLADQVRGPSAPGALDATSRGLISQERQAQGQQLQSGLSNIKRRFGNSPVGSILASQARSQAQLGQNPLAFQASLGQSGRQAAENQVISQAQNAVSNPGQVGQQQVQNQHGLLTALAQVGQILGGTQSDQINKSKGAGF
jgi:hypothetical protein